MIAKKLRISENTEIITLNAPPGYKKSLGTLPKGATIKNKLGKKHDFIHLFVNNKAELEKAIFKAVKPLNPGGLIWISYPKVSSGVQTDLTRDRGWECLSKIKMRWLSLISFDDNWSAFLMKNEAPEKQSRASKEYHSNVAKYVDAASKTVKLPADLEAALEKNKKAADFFRTLNFTGRKEYVMWIVSAKQESTRNERVKKTIAKLLLQKKTPAEK